MHIDHGHCQDTAARHWAIGGGSRRQAPHTATPAGTASAQRWQRVSCGAKRARHSAHSVCAGPRRQIRHWLGQAEAPAGWRSQARSRVMGRMGGGL